MAEQKAKLDFASGQASDSDPLAGAIPQTVNLLVDKAGAMHVRPGIATWDSFAASPLHDDTTTVDGIGLFGQTPVYVTSDRLVHAQLAPGLGVDLSDATATTQLDGASRPVFAPTRTRMIIAGGSALQKWDGPSAPLTARLGGSPPPASHVVAISQRLVVNPAGLSGQIQWSDPGDSPGHETWSGEFLELESRPDALPALYDSTGELIGLGTATVQTLAPDPAEIFKSIRTWDDGGTAAPYSFARAGESFAFLDSLRRFQLGNGRSYKEISSGIATDIENLSTLHDCWGMRAKIDGWNLLVWHFPTDARSFAFDLDNGRWSEWRGHINGQWTAWAGKSHAFWPEQNLHLIGLSDGIIGKLDPSSHRDNGTPIVAEAVTGFDDHGVDNFKQHFSTRFMFRRGLGSGSVPGPRCQLSWRDGTGAWEGPIELDLGNADDPTPIIEARTLGVYRTRQWKLRMSDDVPLTFVGATVTFEVLET